MDKTIKSKNYATRYYEHIAEEMVEFLSVSSLRNNAEKKKQKNILRYVPIN